MLRSKPILRCFTFIFCVLSCVFILACAPSDDVKPEIKGAFTNAMPPGQSNAAVYMIIDNPTDKDLVVNYISTPASEAVEIHRVIYENGMMNMRPVSHLKIPRFSKLVFEPGGYHFMLIGVHERLEKGQSFELNVEFEGGVKLSHVVAVK